MGVEGGRERHEQRLKIVLKGASTTFRFDRFALDTSDRRLRFEGRPVELNARYFDALELLVRNAGSLVSKDRFLDEVWSGVPVTDEALTQCVKELRKALGDNASHPRFIETAPKHGYRFIAPVDIAGPVRVNSGTHPWREALLLGAAGTIGGGFAGFIGGLIYGFAGASEPPQPGTGAISVLLVILCLCVAVALMGALGVSFGISIATHLGKRDWRWTAAGGASGGLLVGAVVKLVGLDAFNLLFGHSPAGMTGAFEGAIIGTGVGLSAAIALRSGRLRRSMFAAAFIGAAAGISIVLMGGRLMAGSLDLLGRTFPDSRLQFDRIGAIFGEPGFGFVSQVATAGLEGALFSACLVGAITIARRSL